MSHKLLTLDALHKEWEDTPAIVNDPRSLKRFRSFIKQLETTYLMLGQGCDKFVFDAGDTVIKVSNHMETMKNAYLTYTKLPDYLKQFVLPFEIMNFDSYCVHISPKCQKILSEYDEQWLLKNSYKGVISDEYIQKIRTVRMFFTDAHSGNFGFLYGVLYLIDIDCVGIYGDCGALEEIKEEYYANQLQAT